MNLDTIKAAVQAATTKVQLAASKPSKARIKKEYRDDLKTVPWCKFMLAMILSLVLCAQALNVNALSFVDSPSNDTVVIACGELYDGGYDWPAPDEDAKVCLVKTKQVAFNVVVSFPEHATWLRRNLGLR